jgi:hypothetical protein
VYSIDDINALGPHVLMSCVRAARASPSALRHSVSAVCSWCVTKGLFMTSIRSDVAIFVGPRAKKKDTREEERHLPCQGRRNALRADEAKHVKKFSMHYFSTIHLLRRIHCELATQLGFHFCTVFDTKDETSGIFVCFRGLRSDAPIRLPPSRISRRHNGIGICFTPCKADECAFLDYVSFFRACADGLIVILGIFGW